MQNPRSRRSSPSPAAPADEEPGPRRRLLDTADRLFYEEGVHVVGIDRLLEESGVAKASLYSHFGNKDGLVRAYLEEHFEVRRQHVAQVLARYNTPRTRLLGLFADVEDALANPLFRGCRFVNASAEARADESIGAATEEYRSWIRALFTDLAKEAKAKNPKRLGRQLALLYDGAAVAARLDVDRAGAADAALSAATALVDAATLHTTKPTRRRGTAPATTRARFECQAVASPTMDEPNAATERGVTAHAKRDPDRPAMVMGETTYTYGQLHERAQRLATVLADLGAGPGRPVAAVLPNGIEPFEVATATAMLGAPYLPINWHLKAGELAYIFADAGVAVVVGHTAFEADLATALASPGVSCGSLVVGGNYEPAIEAAPPFPDGDSGPGPELMFYTSGTTSRPKGVILGNLANDAGRHRGMQGQVDLWSWTPDDIYIMSGPAYHAAHAGWALTALYIGATTVITDRFEARAFLEEISRNRGTRSFMVPAHFIRILELSEEERGEMDLSSLSLIVHAAAPCPIVVKTRMMEAFPHTEIHELYGASEGGATRISPQEWRDHPGSVGLPWPGVEIRILDEDGNPVDTGEPGLVYIKPPGGIRFTYRNDEEATSRAWRDDAFTVGDIGHLDPEGFLYITDRVSDMVLWGGVNIAPREIEEVLYQHPGVVDCAVFGIPDERDGERLKAMVQLRHPVETEELAEFVRDRLASYKVPHVWETVEELPRDQNGKVLKRLLRQAHLPAS